MASTRVDPRILEHRRQRRGVALRPGVSEQVHRVAAGPGARKRRAEPREGRGSEGGELAAAVGQGVGGEHAEASAVRHDGEAVARRRSDAGKVSAASNRSSSWATAQHPGATERCVVDGVRARQGSRVGAHRARARLAAPGLHDDHRLAARGGAPGGHELAPVPHRLHVQQDRLGVGVEGQPVEQVAEVDVGHVAEGGDAREADAARVRPVEHRGRDGAGLGDEGDLAGLRRHRREARVEAEARREEADAVGPEHAQQVGPRRVEQRLLELAAALRGVVGEARADHDRGPRAPRAELGDETGHARRGRGDHREVRRLGQARDVG